MEKNKSPLVTVLITSFNRDRYISGAIESVLASTYSNLELIIVDDASTDNTAAIAKKYAAADARVHVFVNEKNLGDYPNRNLAASYATGKYLKYVDSDDYIYPGGLEIMVNSMEKFTEAGFGLCSLKPDAKRPFPFMLQPKESYEYHFFGPGLFHKGPLTAIFLKSAFDAEGGFNTERMISDLDMWHRMALKYPVVLMQEGIVWQRMHKSQELQDAGEFIIQGAKIKWKYLLSPECPLSKEQLKSIRRSRIERYSGFVLSGIGHFNFKQVETYWACLFFTARVKI